MPSNMRFVAFCLVLAFTNGLLACLTSGQEVEKQRPNILFIAVDDLRPEIACFGAKHMHTPQLDHLASRGVLFERAYCMVPTCGASRASLMTSVRPTRGRFTTYFAWAQKDAPAAVPIHTHFKANGYHTVSLGKVFHNKDDHADGWSEPPWRSKLDQYQKQAEYRSDIKKHRKQFPQKTRHRGMPFEFADAEDSDYPDGECTDRALEYLEKLSQVQDKPFFLAVGFRKPHLPFNAPQKYWDLYDIEDIDLPTNYHAPKDAPKAAVHNSGELRSYAEIHPSKPVDRAMARQLIHGYYACVSFIDAQIGRLLEQLDESGLSENTIIVLWGDHGWQLGEHGMWNKHSCFETSMLTPLIVVQPGGAEQGTRTRGMVEFIDIYPSLCEMAGLEIPAHVEGKSFVTLLADPTLPGKPFAVGRFKEGDTIRSKNFRFSTYSAKNGAKLGEMLYDHRVDTAENFNQASQEREVVAELRSKLQELQGK